MLKEYEQLNMLFQFISTVVLSVTILFKGKLGFFTVFLYHCAVTSQNIKSNMSRNKSSQVTK